MAVAVLAGILVPALPATIAAATTPAATTTRVQWGDCPEDYDPDTGVQCGTVRVPVDYHTPNGRTIEIAVSRVPAANPALRRGVLLMNPGGPGGPGHSLPLWLGGAMSQDIRDRYDLVGFDPRFVGLSSAIACGQPTLPSVQVERIYPYLLPGGVRENADLAKDTADLCAKNAGADLPYMTTANTARDMDAIRAALGEEKISYLGYSYGTYLGSVYASLHPARTDRIVLDSVVGVHDVHYKSWRAWGPATEIRFPDFARHAADQDDIYHLGSTPAAVRATYLRLTRKLDKKPISYPSGVVLNGNVLRTFAFGQLEFDSAFPTLAAMLHAVDEDDVETLKPIADSLTNITDEQLSAAWGIACGDVAWPRSVARYEQTVRRDGARYPIAGAMAANIRPCAFWHFKPQEPLVPITGRGPRNILLVQNARDHVTPLSGAWDTRRALGPRASLLVAEQGGHASYLLSGNSCVDARVTDYLVTGVLPTDTRCPTPTSASDAVTATKARGQKPHRDRAVKEFIRQHLVARLR